MLLERDNKMKPVYQKALKLMFLLIVMNAIGAVGSLFITSDALNWYYRLPLAPFTPPAVVFAVVWPVLYVLMAIAAFLCWGKASPRWFSLFSAMTLLWPFVFFRLREITGGFIVIVLMFMCYMPLMRDFGRVSHASAWLLVPVGIWTVFAAYLNGWLVVF